VPGVSARNSIVVVSPFLSCQQSCGEAKTSKFEPRVLTTKSAGMKSSGRAEKEPLMKFSALLFDQWL